VTRSLRTRIALTAVAATALALLAVALLVGPGLRRRAEAQAREALTADVRLIVRLVAEPLSRGAGPEELDRLVDSASRDARVRVTVMAPDGRVVGDSSLSGPALAAIENHANRPEVRDAVARGQGESIRHSTTVEDDLLYVAIAVRGEGGRLLGIARAGTPLTGVAEQAATLSRAVFAAAGLAFGLIVLLSAWLARPLAGPIAEIMAGARQFAAGNLGARIAVNRDDELGELAGILNLSAERLGEQLAQSARDRGRLEAILSAMESGVLAVDHRGTVVLANDALRRSLSLADPVGRHYVEAVRRPEVGELIDGVLASGRPRTLEIELSQVSRFFVLTGVSFPSGEDPPGVVVTFHDVTERRRLDRVRRDFVANASHELRTPLTSIRGFVEALEDGAMNDPETAARFLGKIRTHADRMAALVSDLLDLSRLESGERPARLETVSPAEIVADVAEAFGEPAQRKAIALRHAAHSSASILSDAERLRRILDNLVDNAVKYTPEGGMVEVTLRPAADGGAAIEIRDNGPGIPAEHLPRLFERFYRVDKARSRELGGTGLGLAIVRHLAESIAAKVTVESEPGRGTCFTVSLPPAPPGAPPLA
jgi:two-component system phosphate regulon sensor histidine kinase PhoR